MELLFPKLEREKFVEMNTLTLAHTGDCIFELLARSYVAQMGTFLPAKAHKLTVSLVSAKAQAKMIYGIRPILTEEEDGFFRRGRNSSPKTMAKSAEVGEYMAATGLEALFGALYFQGNSERIVELFKACIDAHNGSGQ